MATSTLTQSANAEVSTVFVPADWQRLANLNTVIQELSGQRCIEDLRNLFEHANNLQATVKEREVIITELNEKLQVQANEMNRLTKEHRDRQEEVMESHARLLRKREDEKMALQQAVTRQESELRNFVTSVQHLESRVENLNKQLEQREHETEKIEALLQQARGDSKHHYKSVQEHKEQLKSVDQQWQSEKKAHGQSKSQVEALQKRCADLEAEVKLGWSRWDEIERLAPPLMEDNLAEVSKAITKIWKQCMRLIQSGCQENTPAEQLTELNIRRSLGSSDLITYAIPLAPTNSLAARRMRVCATLAILADALVHHLFTSTDLLKNTTEMDELMLRMADADPHREAFLRRLLNNTSSGAEPASSMERAAHVTSVVIKHIQPLLTPEQTEKMSTGLTDTLKTAAELWRSLRRRQSYFTVETQPPNVEVTWSSLIWDESRRTFNEESVTTPNDITLVLFPRVIALNHEQIHEVFPGVVLLKSETRTALTELSELPPSSPIAGRSSTHRAVGGRRGTLDRKSESGAFLVANGSPKSSA